MGNFRILLFVFLCFFKLQVNAQSKINFGVISKENIILDLEKYKYIILHEHVQPFTRTSKKDFLSELSNIIDSSEKLSIDQLMVRWLQLNAKIGDEHTTIGFTNVIRDRIPVSFYHFKEGYFITAAQKQYNRFLYCKLIGINDIPIENVAKQIETIIPDTNTSWRYFKIPEFLYDPYILHGLGIIQNRTQVTYKVVSVKGDTMTFAPEAIDKTQLSFNEHYFKRMSPRNSVKGNYGFTFLDSTNIVYVRVAKCEEMERHSFQDFVQELEDKVNAKHPRKIIIDLRDNGGGKVSLVTPLLKYLNGCYLNKKGQIFVLIGRNTFSAAILTASFLRSSTYCTVVGEPSGGSVVHFGHVLREKLPATNMMMQYSTSLVATSEKNEGSMQPDVEIETTFRDFLNSVDASIEYIVKN